MQDGNDNSGSGELYFVRWWTEELQYIQAALVNKGSFWFYMVLYT